VTAAEKPPKRRFQPAAGGTLPNADEAFTQTSGRLDVTTSARQTPSQGGRSAFTWRLTAEQAITLDEMTLRLKRELGRARLDRAEMLAALVGLAADNPAMFGALVARLQSGQTS
jgi:hypothetical protein